MSIVRVPINTHCIFLNKFVCGYYRCSYAQIYKNTENISVQTIISFIHMVVSFLRCT